MKEELQADVDVVKGAALDGFCNLSIKVARRDYVRWLCAAKESNASLTAIITDALNHFEAMVGVGAWTPGPVAAEFLGISLRSLQRQAAKGQIDRNNDGRHSLYWVSGSEAAATLGISERQLRRRAAAGKVKRRKTGGRVEYLPTNEAAAALGISRRTIQRRARSGQIETRPGVGGAIEYRVPSDARGPETGFVYVISGRDSCKIGYTTKDPKQRLAALQTGNPQQLRLSGYVPGCMELESRAHSHFHQNRLEGEWFSVPPSDVVAWLYTQTMDTRDQAAVPVIEAVDALRLAIEAMLGHDA